MAVINLSRTTPETEEFARKVCAENNGTMTELGIHWSVQASPQLVIKRGTFDEVYKTRPKWDQDALWRGTILSYEGNLTKQSEDGYIIEDDVTKPMV